MCQEKEHILKDRIIGEQRVHEAINSAVEAINFPFAWRYYNNKVKRFKRLKLI